MVYELLTVSDYVTLQVLSLRHTASMKPPAAPPFLRPSYASLCIAFSASKATKLLWKVFLGNKM